MDQTISQFYTKYSTSYESQHGARLDAMVAHFGFDKLRDQKVLDVGGGMGFLGKRLHPSNSGVVVDGADFPQELLPSRWVKHGHDLNYHFAEGVDNTTSDMPFDIGFCLETLEHLENPYRCLVEIKKLVKLLGYVVISIPDETVWHNTVYTGLLWPRSNFEQFLGQMALSIKEFWHFIPQPNGGWPAYHYLCTNETWDKKVMMYPKSESKFLMATPVEMTNL